MNKHIIEAFKLHQTRRAMHRAMREARTALCTGPRVVQVRKLTTQELDRFMQRRIEHDSAQHVRALALRASKKKLPMPVFACENERYRASDLTGGETDQVRPRVVGRALGNAK